MKFLLLLFLSLNATLSIAEENWQLALDKDGIQVYTRENPTTNFKDFKAFITLNAPFKDVVPHFYQVENHTQWVYERKHTQILKDLGKHSSIVYFISRAPWPISDRDAVTNYIFTKDTDNHLHITVKNIDGIKPHHDDMVRLPYLESSWDIVKLDDKHTKIEFISSADPGGNIPSFLADSAVVDLPYYSLSNLQQLLLKQN